MKKKFLSLALIALSFAGFSSMAQTNQTCPVSQEKVQCQRTKKECNKGKARCNPFEGLTLTDAQKAKLEELRTQRAAAHKDRAKDVRADRHRRDSLGMAARRADKKKYLEEVKAIIGPDQYVIFLENMVVNGAPEHHKAFRQGDRRNHATAGERGRRSDKARKHAYKGKGQNRTNTSVSQGSQATTSANS